MLCPHCQNYIKYPTYAWNNVRQNDESCTVATICCGKPVVLYPLFSVGVVAAETFGETDDWDTRYASE